jgi:hypothetical protein
MLTRFRYTYWKALMNELKAFSSSQSQLRLLLKLNLYQLVMRARDQETGTPVSHSRVLLAMDGYCNGMTATWLDYISKGREEEFYAMLDKIKTAPLNQMSSAGYAPSFEKLISFIEYRQNPEKYSKQVKQSDLDVILEVDKSYEQIITDLTQAQLAELLSLQINENSLIAISITGGGIEHVIGFYRRGEQYFLYDSNYTTGRPKAFTNAEEAAKEIHQCLIPDGKKIAGLGMTIQAFTKKPPRFAHLIEQQHQEDKDRKLLEYYNFYARQHPESMIEGIGGEFYHHAIIKKDFTRVEKLLRNDKLMLETKLTPDGQTLLHTLATSSDPEITQFLPQALKKHGDISQPNKHNRSALYEAALLGLYDNVIMMLMHTPGKLSHLPKIDKDILLLKAPFIFSRFLSEYLPKMSQDQQLEWLLQPSDPAIKKPDLLSSLFRQHSKKHAGLFAESVAKKDASLDSSPSVTKKIPRI